MQNKAKRKIRLQEGTVVPCYDGAGNYDVCYAGICKDSRCKYHDG